MSEWKLQQACATFLSATLPRDCYWTSVDAGQGAMNLRAAQMRKARGVRAGFVDMLVVWGGRFYGVELKGSKGRLSDIQQITHAQIRDAGGQVEVCHSVEELERALRAWGIPLRGTTLTAQDRDAWVAAAPKRARATTKREPRNKAAMLAKYRAAGVLV
jgi:hypothetical protein